MKKTLIFTATLCLTLFSYAQNSLFEELAKYEKEEFKMYEYFYSSTDKVFKINAKKRSSNNQDYNNFIIYVQENQFGKPLDIDIQEKGENNTPHEYKKSFRHTTYDHYSQPAYISSDLNGADTYVMVDGLLFQIKKGKEDMSSFGYGNVFVPMSLMNGDKNSNKAEEGKKKKMSLKEKLEAKAGKLYGIKPLPEVLKAIDTKEVYRAKINDYISAMRTKQAKSPLTAEEKKEIAAMGKLAQDEKDKIKQANANYWNSEEGQRVLNKDKKDFLHVVNKSNGTIQIIEEDGKTTSFFGPGKTNHYKCNKKIYYCIDCGSGGNPKIGEYIGGGSSSYCGKTITLTK